MNTTAENVSQETLEQASEFLAAWQEGVKIAGANKFLCMKAANQDVATWHQLSPRLDVMRKAATTCSQSDVAFFAAMASFYNAAEGSKLLKKAGCVHFGDLANILKSHQRAVIAALLINFQGW